MIRVPHKAQKLIKVANRLGTVFEKENFHSADKYSKRLLGLSY